MIFIYTTSPNLEEAKKLAEVIIDKKLASAVNLWPTQSIYMWKGEKREGEGAVLFIRTLESKLQEIEDLIGTHNMHGIPCVAAVDVRRINRHYKEHLVECVG
ncbi:divalent-cation tolerance protein CutA [Candidatus Jorgensenbacteria bacterium]|nr:divalent-cation tolerance protein CutA [Candidatus Jorgensenbacteria bacterium]